MRSIEALTASSRPQEPTLDELVPAFSFRTKPLSYTFAAPRITPGIDLDKERCESNKPR